VKELQLKQWIADEAQRHGVGTRAIWCRMYRGKYPGLKLRRVNKRVVFVTVNK
jgi:hypothetical protein